MNPYDLNAIGKILKSQPSGISRQLIARLAIGNKELTARVAELEAKVAEFKKQLETCNSIIKELAIERAVLLCKVKGIAPEEKECQ